MAGTRWTLKQWKEAVGDSPNWEIFEIPAEVIEKENLSRIIQLSMLDRLRMEQL